MTKKAKIWTGVGVGSAAALALGLGLGLGLSSSNYGWNVRTIEFNVQNAARTYANNHTTNVYAANYNVNAQEEVQRLQQGLTVGDLQYDFNRVLTDFYEAYEYEKGSTEVEIEHIKVLRKNDDGSFQLKVTYEVETDTYNINPRDKELIKSKEIKWTPTLVTLTKEDIVNITRDISGFKDNEQNGMDLEDIKELFLGEKDDDKDFDDFDDDDIGIFDKLGKINKDYNNQASIVAYSLSVADIFDQLKPYSGMYLLKNKITDRVVDKNTQFKIPSLSLNGDGSVVLVPNEAPSFKFTSILSGADFTKVFSTDRDLTMATDAETINLVFGNSNQAWKDSVQSIHVDVNRGTLTVKYNDANKAWEEIVIARQW